MSWYSRRKNQIAKASLQKICFLSKSALNLAVNIYGWLNPAENLLGAAIIPPLSDLTEDVLNNWNVDLTLEGQYFTAVADSLARVEAHYSNKHGKRKLIRELAEGIDTTDAFEMDLEDVIRHTETYQEQYMTSVDVRDIVDCFDQVFSQEVPNHPQLSRYFTYRSNQDIISILKKAHILLSATDEQLKDIYSYVQDIKDDTTQIRTDVQKVEKDVGFLREFTIGTLKTIRSASRTVFDILLQSMVIFFSFILASVIFQTQIERDLVIYLFVLASELLIRAIPAHAAGWKATCSVLVTQTLFITASSLLFTNQYTSTQPRMFLWILLCSMAGVSIKFVLQYLQVTTPKKPRPELESSDEAA